MPPHSCRGPWTPAQRPSALAGGPWVSSSDLVSLGGGGGAHGDGKSELEHVGLRMVMSKYIRGQTRKGRRSRGGCTWTQQALVLAAMHRLWMGLNWEPGSHRGPGLGAQDPLLAPYIWRCLSLWLLYILGAQTEGG